VELGGLLRKKCFKMLFIIMPPLRGFKTGGVASAVFYNNFNPSGFDITF
jgi:hypothetical protein